MTVKRSINRNKVLTLLDTNCPNGSGRIVTEPLSASSKTVADTVVLIGTPSLLSCVEKVYDTRSGKPKQGWITKKINSLPNKKGEGVNGKRSKLSLLPKKCSKHCVDRTQT